MALLHGVVGTSAIGFTRLIEALAFCFGAHMTMVLSAWDPVTEGVKRGSSSSKLSRTGDVGGGTLTGGADGSDG